MRVLSSLEYVVIMDRFVKNHSFLPVKSLSGTYGNGLSYIALASLSRDLEHWLNLRGGNAHTPKTSIPKVCFDFVLNFLGLHCTNGEP